MTAAEKLIEKNNYLREQLTAENKEYYEEILVYIRTKSFFHDEEDIETLLMELLNDLLEAQSHGESAKSYFGDNPQKVLDKLLLQLPKVGIKKRFNLMSLIFAISAFFSLFSSLTGNNPSINFLSLIINFVISFFFIQSVFFIISKEMYRPKRKKFLEFFFLFIIMFIAIGLNTFSNYIGQFWLSISVPTYTGLLLVWGALIILSIWIISKKAVDFYYAIPSTMILALMPTLKQVPWTAEFFNSNQNKIIIVVVMIALLLFISYLNAKRIKKNNN